MSNTTGKWLGWIAITIVVIGFFWQPIWMGSIATILGICGLFTLQKTLNWIAVAAGIVVLIIGFI